MAHDHRTTPPHESNNASNGPEQGDCVAHFDIFYHQRLNAHGDLIDPLSPVVQSAELLISLYRAMVQTRTFDSKTVALQRTGKMGTFSSSLGQEAVGVAIGSAMRPEDVLLPTYREVGAQFLRGVTMTEILLYWGGDERGMAFTHQAEDFPTSVPIATQVPHAAGVATAMKLRQQPRVAVVTLGDGATSKGDFYEGINLAGAWQLPMVTVVVNNQWAISVPRAAQTHASTLAQKAIAAGVPGEQVDGNDVIALYERLTLALDKARRGEGPTLIEAITYRMSDHTTADDASRYRSGEELERQKLYDPITRMKKYLLQQNLWTESQDESLKAECSAKMEEAVRLYLDTPPRPPETMFDYLYETLPHAYHAQRAELTKVGGG
ncbi:MAG: pyruvate dehydrogenase E1 component subunit alpha [Halothiobacillaceae bacterium]|nr:MAG: pyruvate dehydrogenase E1 component subunit alpha [Halothiobacillaceae bacterium]